MTLILGKLTTQYKMDIEGGVYYNNRWGGTKFIVQKN